MLALEDRDLVRSCGEHGTGVLAYGPLAFGLLTGAITRETTFAEGDWRGDRGADSDGARLFGPGNLERSLAVTDGVRRVADRLGVTSAQVALAWCIAQPGVTAAIAGSRNPDHARANAAAGNLSLDAETIDELESLLPLGLSS